jgi:hypothetical protein
MEIWRNDVSVSGTQILRLHWTIPATIQLPSPLYDLITLILHISISTEQLIQLFGSLPSLRTIIVSGETVFNVIFALIHQPAVPHSVTFPALRSLSIRAIDYTSSIGPGQEIDLLLRCIRERRERNASLEELEILQCKHIREYDVKLLQKVVDVRWDS